MNKLLVNYNKNVYLHVHPYQLQSIADFYLNFPLDGNQITIAYSTKFVWVDQSLKWKIHCQSLPSKLN